MTGEVELTNTGPLDTTSSAFNDTGRACNPLGIASPTAHKSPPTMDIAHPISSEVTSLSFSFLSSEDIRSISVQRVEAATLLDNLNMPTRGGLYDPKLGPMNKGDM